MKIKELYYLVKLNNQEKVVLIKSGNFYYAYDTDGIILWNIFNYKYKENKVGFPVKVINEIISKLNKLGLNVIVIKSKNNIINYNTTMNETIMNLYKNIK